MKQSTDITFETTAYHYPNEGGVESVHIKVKVNVLNDKIFYHVVWMGFEKRNFLCGILILKNTLLFSSQYNYTFRHEGKDYYLNIEI